MLDSTEYASFRRKLVRWYADRARDLPWRRTTDPYRIWVSEIMLQQTTVVAVIPYFERFITRFPTVTDLANADESDVLRLWEGLGYYSRARNLHKAANVIVEQHGGDFPRDLETLKSLPGIGRYTAGAIVSFAFDQPAPIVEANTMRLFCRILGYDGDPRSSDGQVRLWSFAEAILTRKEPGRINQSLMELGATVCSPSEPDCETCPVQIHCQAFRNGTQATIPQPKKRIAITDVTEVSIAIENRSKYLLRRRTVSERWAGLWDFVRFEVDKNESISAKQLVDSVQMCTGLSVELGPLIAEWKHAVTRYRISLKCFRAKKIQGRLGTEHEWSWVKPADFHSYPLSVTARQFAEILNDQSQ